jgi:hypothetical protein
MGISIVHMMKWQPGMNAYETVVLTENLHNIIMQETGDDWVKPPKDMALCCPCHRTPAVFFNIIRENDKSVSFPH